MIGDGITIERGAFIGPGVAVTNDVYPRFPRLEQARNRYRGRDWLARTVVGERATLGTGAIVVAGLAIGVYALVGAGAVVTRHVAAFALVVGNPARRRGWVCVCGSRLNFHRGRAVCGSCGLEFRQTDTGVESTSAAAGSDA